MSHSSLLDRTSLFTAIHPAHCFSNIFSELLLGHTPTTTQQSISTQTPHITGDAKHLHINSEALISHIFIMLALPGVPKPRALHSMTLTKTSSCLTFQEENCSSARPGEGWGVFTEIKTFCNDETWKDRRFHKMVLGWRAYMRRRPNSGHPHLTDH